MSFLGTLVRNLWRQGRVERDLDEEVQAQLELLIDQHRATGMDEAAARRAARLELGGAGQVKDAVRDVRRGVWLEHLWRDLGYGCRRLRRQPGIASGSSTSVRILGFCNRRLGDAQFDGTMLLFTLAVSLLTAAIFGLAPALQVSQVGIIDSLKEAGHGLSASRHHNRLRSVLVIADVAIAAALRVGAGLLIQSGWRLQHVDPGFNPNHVLTFKIDLPHVRYSGAAQTEFFERLSDRLRRLPGVAAASAVLPLPLDGDDVGSRFEIDGQPMTAAERPRAQYAWDSMRYRPGIVYRSACTT